MGTTMQSEVFSNYVRYYNGHNLIIIHKEKSITWIIRRTWLSLRNLAMYSASWDIRIFRVSKWKSIVKEKGLPAAATFAEEIHAGVTSTVLISAFNADFVKFIQQIFPPSYLLCPSCLIQDSMALVHHQKTVAVLHGIAEVVCDHDSGRFFPGQFSRVSSMIISAVFGSRAAVCSSRIRNSMGVIVDIKSHGLSLSPQRTPTLTSSLSSRPQPSMRRFSR